MRRAALVALSLLVLAGGARADLDPRNYRELPGGAQRMVSSITVRPGDTAIAAEVRKRYAGQHPSGDYDVYIGREGTVDGIHVVRSLEGCDEFIAKHLATIRQTPKPPEPWVRHVTVELRFDSAAVPNALRAKNVPPHLFDTELIEHPTPHLPENVLVKAAGRQLPWLGKVCANADGSISQVSVVSGIPGADSAISETVRTWRLRPQPIPICTIVRFVFDVPAKRK